MTRGVILVKTGPHGISKVLESVKKIQGVTDALAVFGRFDLVVFLEAKDFEGFKGLSLKVNSIQGVRSTETLPEA